MERGLCTGVLGGQSAPEEQAPVWPPALALPGGQEAGSREQGTGCREQGAGSREQGAGNREQRAGSREQGAGNREHCTGNW